MATSLEFSEDCIEAHLARFSGRTHAVYLVILALLIAALVALPLLRVDVDVSSAGIIRPTIEKQDVRAAASGVVSSVLLHEGDTLHAGDVIATLRHAAAGERAASLSEQLAAKRALLSDLEILEHVDPESTANVRFGTARYAQDYAQLTAEVFAAAERRRKAETELRRTQALYERRVATATELEDAQFKVTQARGDVRAAVQRARARWESELLTLRLELRDLESRRAGAGEELRLYSLRAPVTGTLEELYVTSAGSWVQSGDRIAVISPDSRLVAEVYASPRDVAFIHPGQAVRLLVDAFNHNDWGSVPGRVLSVSGDFVDRAGTPMFKVTCSVERTSLALPTGVQGSLRKGMTLRAHFLLARRTLFQLLRDNLADWLDPAASRVS